MKKLVFAIFIIFLSAKACFCANFDYIQTYRDLSPADFTYIHDIDPDQYYDCKGYTWSPYPLFRLSSPLYFKNITIEPGYYNLTPREHKGKYYVLFKEQGLVKYIIPAYDSDFVPEFFYEENLPKERLTAGQKFQIGLNNVIGKISPAAKRKPMPKSYLEVNELDKNFISIVVYFKEFKYYLILRTVKM